MYKKWRALLYRKPQASEGVGTPATVGKRTGSGGEQDLLLKTGSRTNQQVVGPIVSYWPFRVAWQLP